MNIDVMSPISMSASPKISALTLAMFEDSGWYSSNFSAADTYAYGAPPSSMCFVRCFGCCLRLSAPCLSHSSHHLWMCVGLALSTFSSFLPRC